MKPLIIIAALVITFSAWLISDMNRYSLHEVGGMTTLLDKKTGQSWRRVVLRENNGELYMTFWQEMLFPDVETQLHLQEKLDEKNAKK